MLNTVKLVYKNMWVGRPKWCVAGFALMYIYFAVSTYLGCIRIEAEYASKVQALGMAYQASSVVPWVGLMIVSLGYLGLLPFAIAWIDLSKNPDKFTRLEQTSWRS